MCNEPRRDSTQMSNFISTFSGKRICWLLLNQTKHSLQPASHTTPTLKTLDLQMSPFFIAVGAKGIPFPVLVACAFNLGMDGLG